MIADVISIMPAGFHICHSIVRSHDHEYYAVNYLGCQSRSDPLVVETRHTDHFLHVRPDST